MLLASAVGVVFVARQLGIRINSDSVETPIRAGRLRTRKDFDEYFSNHGVLTKLRTLRVKDLLSKSYLFPCVCLMKDGRSFILVGTTDSGDTNKLEFIAIDPIDPTAQPEKFSVPDFTSNWSGQAIFVSKFSGVESRDRILDWKWFLPELYRFKGVIAVTFFISLLLHCLAILPIVYIQITLDKVLSYEAVSTLYVLTGGVVLLLVFTGLLTYGRDYIINHISSIIESRLTGDTFDKLMDLPAQNFQMMNPGEVESNVQSVVTIRSFISRQVLTNFYEIVGLLVFVPLIFGYSPVLALLIISFAILQGLIELVSKLRQADIGKTVAKANRKRVQTLRETISSIDAVKSLSQQTSQRRQWRTAAAQGIRRSTDMFRANNVATSLNATLSSLMTIAIVFTGVNLVFAGNLSTGAIISCVMLGSKVIGPAKKLITVFPDLQTLRNAMDQVGSIWNATPERVGLGSQHIIKGGYKFNNVTVRFRDIEVLRNLDFQIPARSVVAIVGSSAGGKSTIFRLLQGLLKPSAGFIEIDGTNLASLDLNHYRSQVALVNANNVFFTGTIEENIQRVRTNISTREMEVLLEDSGLDELLRNLPKGISTGIDQTASSLSKSYKIVVALARALATDPNLLLLDDCFNNLDKYGQVHLKRNLTRIARGRTIIATIQDMRFINEFDWIIVLEQGQIVGQGGHSELMKNCAHYNRLWELENEIAVESSSAKLELS